MEKTKRIEEAKKSAAAFMKANGLGAHDGIRAKAEELWLEAWDSAIHQASLLLRAKENHDQADEILKLK